MRLGQLARKYDVKVQEIISFLEENVSTTETIHPNSKLDDEASALVAEHFDLLVEIDEEAIVEPIEIDKEESEELTKEEEKEEVPEEETIGEIKEVDEVKVEGSEEAREEKSIPEPVAPETPAPKPIEPPKEPATPLDDIAMVEGEFAILPEQDETVAEEPAIEEPLAVAEEEKPRVAKVEKEAPKEDEVIDTERLLELLESEEEVPELEKIKLIKASKKELSGLKVLGKIEVPQTQKKEEEKKESEAKSPKYSPEELQQRQKAREEQREKRRQLAKKKDAEQKARQEKQKREREENKRRAKREAHYKQKLDRAKAFPTKPKTSAPTEPIMPEIESTPEPKTFFARLWRYLSTGSDW